MRLDPPTLWLTLTMTSLVSTGAFLGLRRYAPRVPGPQFWALYSLLLSISFGSALFELPDWRVGSLLFNIPGALSPMLLMEGSLRFNGRGTDSRLSMALAASAILAITAYTYIWPNVALRIAAVSTVFAVGYTGAAIATTRQRTGGARLPALVLAASFSLLSVATVARAVAGLWQPVLAAFDIRHIDMFDLIVFPVVAATTMLSAPFLVLLVATRLHEQLESERLRTTASHERIRRLAQRVEVVREEERRSIAHTLHEGISQDLAAARFALSAGQRACDDHSKDGAIEAIGRSIRHLRELTDGLRPTTLALLSLPDAVSVYARTIAENFAIVIEVFPPEKAMALDEPLRVVFFRAAQEALTNVVRHAHATQVEISFQLEGGRAAMTVRDDGVGICAGDLEKDQAFGLLGIRERLGAIGGEVRIAMGHSRGTTITVLGPALTLNPASAWHGAESLAT